MRGNGLVISGVSGRYPKSPTIDQLAENLFNKIDFASVDGTRGPPGILGLPERSAKLSDVEKFDNEYFGLSEAETDYLGGEIRITMEAAVEALFDAGIDPETIRGSRCGVYLGVSMDSERSVGDDVLMKAVQFQLIASRLSWSLDLHGPSMGADSACGASFSALQSAIGHMNAGQCDMAIVLGYYTLFAVTHTSEFRRLKMTSPDGRCKVWDKGANGYMSSECVSAIVIQRASDAKRIYAHLVAMSENSDGYKERGITFPSWEYQREVILQAYRESGINPLDVHYVEAHGTGTQAGDPTECRSIAAAMCTIPGRQEPLHIGAVKSCIGHVLSPSGLASVHKVVIAFETGLIPPDQNFTEVNPRCQALANGTLINVTEATPLKGDYCGINNFGFGGSNFHCILKRHLVDKPLNQSVWQSAIGTEIPRIICMNGRTNEAVEHFFTALAGDDRRLFDPEFLALINEVNESRPTPRTMCTRGYAIVSPSDRTLKVENIKQFGESEIKFPVRIALILPQGPSDLDLAVTLKQIAAIPFVKQSLEATYKYLQKNHEVSINPLAYGRLAVELGIIDLLRGVGIDFAEAHGASVSSKLVAKYALGEMTREQLLDAIDFRRDKCVDDGSFYRDMNDNLVTTMGVEQVPLVRLVAIESSDVEPIEINGKNLTMSLIHALGQLYTNFGVNVAVERLYRQVAFPVSRGTPSLSSLIRWRHDRNHMVLKFPEYCNPFRLSSLALTFNLIDRETKHWIGHKIDGRILLPAMGYLLRAWCYEADRQGIHPTQTCVRFWKVKFHRATLMGPESEVKLELSITKPCFQFCDTTGAKVVTGYLHVWRTHGPNSDDQVESNLASNLPVDGFILERDDVYKLLRLRGYDYGPTFQGIQRVTSDGRQAEIRWTGKWDSFADSMLHAALVSHPGHALALPVGIDHIEFNHSQLINWVDENGIFVPSSYDPACGTFTAPGVHMKGIHLAAAPRKLIDTPKLEQCSFYPFIENKAIDSKLRGSIQEYLTKFDQAMSMEDGTEPFKDLGSYIKANESGAIMLKILVEAKSGYQEAVESKNEMADGQEAMADSPTKEPPSQTAKDFDTRLLDRFNVHKGALHNDLIESPVSNERIIRQLVDIVIENHMRLPLVVHEFTMSTVSMHSHVMASSVANLDHLSARSTTKYIIHHPEPKTMAPINNEWNEPKIEKWSEFPSSVQNEAKPEAEVESEFSEGTLDVAVFRATTIESLWHAAKTGWDMAKFLGQVAKGLKIGGFALFLLKERLLPHELPLIGSLLKSSGHECPGHEFWTSFTDIKGWLSVAKEMGLELVAHKSDSITNCGLLLRKIIDLPKPPMIFEIPESYLDKTAQDIMDYDWVERLKDRIKSLKDDSNPGQKLWLVSRGHQFTGIQGLFGALRRNYGVYLIHCLVDLRQNNGVKSKSTQDLFEEDALYREALQKDLSLAVIDENGRLGAYFFSEYSGPDPVEAREGAASLAIRGDLSSVEWIELDHLKPSQDSKRSQDPPSDPNQSMCSVYYSALNFRDVMQASGNLPNPINTGDNLKDNVFGLEFSGIDQDGRRIMGMCPQKGLATNLIISDRRLLLPVPDHWTLEEAATIPVVYTTAYYAMIIRGKITAGESILIHSATGGVGQAAINVALSRGLTVYATVGTLEKRKFLLELFPQIDPQNVASSRDLSFEKMIMRRTRGRGVDLVLNSLAGDKLQASLRCLAPQGRFLEIGKVDMIMNEDMNPMDEASFHGVAVDAFIYPNSTGVSSAPSRQNSMKDLKSAFELLLADAEMGVIKPLNRTVYDHNQIEDAFRFMAAGKHTGKILIKMREEAPKSRSIVDPPLKRLTPRVVFDPRKSYILAGGLGGIGLETGAWMIQRGARRLVLTSRSGIKNAYQKYRLNQMEQAGAKIIISKEDMLTQESAAKVLAIAQNLGPLGGVFNVSLVLHDDFFEKQTAETFSKVNAKAVIASHLDRLTRDLTICPQPPDYFVCFSSVSNRIGLAQPNYNYANAICERICERRRKSGLHGLAIQWGSIGDVGYVADREMTKDKINLSMLIPQRIPSYLYHFERFLLSPQWLLHSVNLNAIDGSGVRNANPLAKLCHVMGIKNPEKLNPKATLGELGIDSLVAVEMRQMLEREYDLVLSTEEIRKLTVEECRNLDKRAKTGGGSKAKETAKTPAKDSPKRDPSEDLAAKSEVTNKDPDLHDITKLLDNVGRICMPLNDRAQDAETREAMILFGGAEGTFETCDPLVTKSSQAVIGVIWGGELLNMTDWEEICGHILRALKAAYPRLKTVDLVGHSFGSVVAFELGRFVQGHESQMPITIGSMVFLDGSLPLFQAIYNRAEEEDLPEAYREAAILIVFAAMFLPSDSVNNMKQEMSFGDTRDEQLHLVATLMRDQFSLNGQNFKLQDIKLAAKLYRHRIHMVLKSSRQPPFCGDVLLIKSADSSKAYGTLTSSTEGSGVADEDYSVGTCITGRCTVLTMEGRHETFISANADKIAQGISDFMRGSRKN